MVAANRNRRVTRSGAFLEEDGQPTEFDRQHPPQRAGRDGTSHAGAGSELPGREACCWFREPGARAPGRHRGMPRRQSCTGSQSPGSLVGLLG